MIAVMLLMFVAGIGLSQAVSDPKQVTLRWLRLGGMISVALLAVPGTFLLTTQWRNFNFTEPGWLALWVPCVGSVIQLVSVQLGRCRTQRWASVFCFLAASASVWFFLYVLSVFSNGEAPLTALQAAAIVPTAPIASGLLGGFLMTMLLGHAYLSAGGDMTQAPFARLVKMLAILLLLRTIASVAFGLWPFLAADSYPRSGGSDAMTNMWDTVMITSRYLVGLVVPAVFTYMIYDCVKRRANQSATGILYVAGVMVIIGEGTALALLKATGLVF